MSGVPAISIERATVRFGPRLATRDVSIDAAEGEVHAIVGENGAGKSTLLRALYGLVPLESGLVRIRGERVARPSPAESIRRGVGMVHQHFMLVDSLSVAENVVLGREPIPPASGVLGRVLGLFDRRRAEREVALLAERHGLTVPPARRVEELSVGEQQRVEIVRALGRGARILILDEPTAVLTPPEVEELFRVLRELRKNGGTVLLVSHKLDEVMAIADRVTVLRRGEVVSRFQRAEASPEEIARAMVGWEVESRPVPRSGERDAGQVRLVLRDVAVAGRSSLAVDGVNLEVRAGEILGVAGVEGNGQAELVAAVVGLGRPARGQVVLDGMDVTRLPCGARRERGLGYVPEDRHRLGLLMQRSVADNLLLGREPVYRRLGGLWLDRRKLMADAERLLNTYDVRPPDPRAPIASLSGGNQQKVVVARELERHPRVLVAAQPTRGVDIGAMQRIHRQLDAARAGGTALLLVSAELDELLALADRVGVLYRGRLVATLPRAEASRERLGALMTGTAA